jgi:hypothetical protein
VRLDLQARRAKQTLPQRYARPCLQNRLLRGDRIEFDAPLFEARGVLGACVTTMGCSASTARSVSKWRLSWLGRTPASE